ISSAMPASFWSAMSMTTTSASCLSATPRATVAPTLPAPPTTVTLRFMLSTLLDTTRAESFVTSVVIRRDESFHIRDDGVRELGSLQLFGADHLSREIVGDVLLRDRFLERL